MSTINILRQLKSKLKKYDIDESFGPGFTNQYLSYSPDDETDVDNVASIDTPYKTHFSIPVPKGKKAGSNYVFGEAKKTDKNDVDDIPADDEADMAVKAADQEVDDTGVDKDMTGDIPTGDTGVSGNVTGNIPAGTGMNIPGLEQEEEKTSTELGRIYELKKIYSRLTSIESYLGNESGSELLEIRNCVSQAIELFEIVSSNFNSYKEKLDEIIVMYYKFILEIYESVKNIYRRQENLGD